METLTYPSSTPPEYSKNYQAGDILPSDNSHSAEYRILKEGRETTGKWVTNEKLRMDYLSLTANLVDRIAQGVEIKNEETGENERQPYTTVIFLDRSARPLSHLVRETWSRFAKDPDTNEVADMPDIKFLNFSRKHWIEQLDPNVSGLQNIHNLDENVLTSLRSVFLTSDSKMQLDNSNSVEKAKDLPALLDGQRILIVDETKFSGETVKIAVDFMRHAFPTAHVDGTYWMNEQFNGTARNPVWDTEDRKNEAMKGVTKRYADLGEKALAAIPETNYYAKGGRENFISSPLASNAAYRELIDEIKALSVDRSVPVKVRQRLEESDDDHAKRILAYTYDIDVSTLSQDQIDTLFHKTIQQIQTIEAEAKKHNPHIR